MYLFDTSAVIDWLYSKRLGEKIDGQVSISVLSLGELLPAAKKKGNKTLNTLEKFLNNVQKIPVTEDIARLASDMKYKLIKEGKEKLLFDIMIAATAKINRLKLITLDTDFDAIGEVMQYDYEVIQT